MPPVETAEEDSSEIKSGDKASQDTRGGSLEQSRFQIYKDHDVAQGKDQMPCVFMA